MLDTTSWRPTVSLTRSSAVLELGKKILAELEGQDDLLTSWIAHYIAQRIEEAQNASAETKRAAEDFCANAILELWRYRSCLPKHLRPFGELEPIQRALASLDVDDIDYRYYALILLEAAAADVEIETKQWLELAFGIDYSARLLIQSALRAAAQRAVSQAEPWVDLARCAGAEEGVESVIVNFVRGGDIETEAIGYRQHEELLGRVSRLEGFAELAMLLAKDLRAEIGVDGTEDE